MTDQQYLTGLLTDYSLFQKHPDLPHALHRVEDLCRLRPQGSIVICLACTPSPQLYVAGVKGVFTYTIFFTTKAEANDHANKLIHYHAPSYVFSYELPTFPIHGLDC